MNIENQNKLLSLTNVMFNAALGEKYYNELIGLTETDASFNELFSLLTNVDVFKSIYSTSLSSDEFAETFISNVINGQTSSTNTEWAIQQAKNLLNAGSSRAELV